jgi:ketosteroid isomerase-like protein
MGILAEWMEQVWNQGNRAAIDDLVAADYTGHSIQGVTISGTAGFREFEARWRSIMDDIHVEVEEEISEGSMSAVRFTVTGKHKRTGNELSYPGASFVRIENGKMQEGWDVFDGSALLESLGVLSKGAIDNVL